MGILAWIIFGALAGWIASMIMGTNEEQGALANIIVGVVGAFIGGLVFNLFGADNVTGFNIYSLLVAIIGSVILLAILKAIRGRGRRTV
jgi:uncharacterized membrane protein YeaQ/YmgE (transglycosylase-associated protein family)